jgi:hypothetical protein
VHESFTHTVPDAYLRQAPTPSQKPSVPQLGAPASVHWPSGSCPAGTLVHEPTEPARLQARQVPVQAEAQQTPCAQVPDWQSGSATQAAPRGDLPQLPPVQTFGATQSVLLVQLVRQSPPPQTNGAQLWVVPATQVPAPSQRAARVLVDPVQLWTVHTVPDAYLRQAPIPSQVPSLPQVATASITHSLSGSVPTETGRHRPSGSPVRDAAQAAQRPAHADSQQTPSTQKADEHSPAAAQPAPFTFFGVQVVPAQ